MNRAAYPKAQWVITLLLLVTAVALIVLHLVLDAGPDKEAPGWIIPASTAAAVACTLLGSLSRPRK